MRAVRDHGPYGKSVSSNNRPGAVILLAVALGTLLAGSVLAREPLFSEYRAVRESLAWVHAV